MAAQLSSSILARLGALQWALEGSAVVPGDPDYDALRSAWNLMWDQRPAVIVAAASAADVVRAVQFAAASGLGVAVQATGHGVAVAADDCVLIVTQGMSQVVIDATNATAWVAAGATWGTVLDAARDVGLAPLLGSSPHVGAVGYVLGGGMGWLGRKYGLGADSVRYFEIVTADGSIVRTGPDERPELFWALRGGGAGTLGVVTGMEVQLYPVTTVYGGNLLYPAESARRVMARYREWIETLPDEMTSSIALMNYPDSDGLPEVLRGRSYVIVRGCYTGSIAAGRELIAFWREWEEPLVDLFGEMDVRNIGMISNDPVDPLRGHSTAEWLRSLDDEVIDGLVDFGLPQPGAICPLTVSEVRHVGGAVMRGGEVPAAYGSRNETLLLQLTGVTPTDDDTTRLVRHLNRLQRQLRDHTTGGAYLNFLEGDDKVRRARSAFTDETWARLQKVKAAIDPSNLFRFGIQFSESATPDQPVGASSGSHRGSADPAPVAGTGGRIKLWPAAIGALAGFVAGSALGIAVYRLVSDLAATATGWEDLASVAMSLVTFGPVGALAGGGLAARRPLRRWWKSRATARRTGVWAGIGIALAGMLGATAVVSEPMNAIAVGVLTLPIAGAAGYAGAALWERTLRRTPRD